MAGAIGFTKLLTLVGRSVLSPDRPILAHLVVTRRCNLSCAYCNEYDRVSDPVPLEMLISRIAALARLKTAVVTLTGGEPLLHPSLGEVVRYVRSCGMNVTLITNGFMLTRERIQLLGDAGLQELQISIDSVHPDEVSKKSLKTLDRKLELLAKFAPFHVNINSVLGLSDDRAHEAVAVARRVSALGFSSSVGLLHDGGGKLKPVSHSQRQAYAEITKLARSMPHTFNYLLFQRNLIRGKPKDWRCRAGARYLYVCEDGLVHWCSQKRGYPAIPVQEYTLDDVRREFGTGKGCAPSCTVTCVRQASALDGWRRQRLPDPMRARGSGC